MSATRAAEPTAAPRTSWRAWSVLEFTAGALGALLGLLPLLGMALAGTPAGLSYGPSVFLVLLNVAFLGSGLRGFRRSEQPNSWRNVSPSGSSS